MNPGKLGAWTLLLGTAASIGFLLPSPSSTELATARSSSQCFVDVAEDGSADSFCGRGAASVLLRSWPAGRFPADGQWHSCPEESGSALCNAVADAMIGAGR